MKAPYFPLYVKDFFNDNRVIRLTNEQLGLYMRLLGALWDKEEECTLRYDDTYICKLLSIRPAKWEKLKEILFDKDIPLLIEENGRFFSKRLKKEFDAMKSKSNKNSEIAKLKWEKHHKSLKNIDMHDANAVRTHNERSANAVPEECERSANAVRTQCHIDTDVDIDTEADTEEISSNSKASSSIEVSTRPPEEHETRESRGDPPPIIPREAIEAALAENLKTFNPKSPKQGAIVDGFLAEGVTPKDIADAIQEVKSRKTFQGEEGQKLFESKLLMYFFQSIIDLAKLRQGRPIYEDRRYRHTKSYEDELDEAEQNIRRELSKEGT